MKMYQVRIGSAEGSSVAAFNDRSFTRLSDAIAQLRRLITLLETDKNTLDDDLSMWIVRTNTKKGEPAVDTELIQMVCGTDEDSGDFCYEGIYYLSKCSDFERMILVGEKKGSWIGDYSVQIASNTVNEVCFFSDLEMILESIKDLRENPEQIHNRLMTLFRRKTDKEADAIAMLLYTLNPDGTLKLQSRVNIEDDDHDADMLLSFIRDEQETEHEEEPSEESEKKAVGMPEDIEGVEEGVEKAQKEAEEQAREEAKAEPGTEDEEVKVTEEVEEAAPAEAAE